MGAAPRDADQLDRLVMDLLGTVGGEPAHRAAVSVAQADSWRAESAGQLDEQPQAYGTRRRRGDLSQKAFFLSHANVYNRFPRACLM